MPDYMEMLERAKNQGKFQQQLNEIKTAACVKLWNGAIKEKKMPSTHKDVIKYYDISDIEIKALGWKINNKNYIWEK